MKVSTTRRQTGVALVLVLWVITLLSVMALAAVSTSRTEIYLVRNRLLEAKTRALADAAVVMAVLRLRSGEEQDHWYPDGSPHAWSFAGEEVEVRLYNESSRLDINGVLEEQLRNLVNAVQVEGVDADAVVDAVMDWHDPDQSARSQGAEEADYRNSGLPYGPKDGDFDSIEEFGLVLGVPRELSRALEPHLTTHSQGSRIVAEYASPLVRAALGLEDPLQQPLQSTDGRVEAVGTTANVTRSLGGPLYRIRVTGGGSAVETLVRVGSGRGGLFSIISRSFDWREEQGRSVDGEAEDFGGVQ